MSKSKSRQQKKQRKEARRKQRRKQLRLHAVSRSRAPKTQYQHLDKVEEVIGNEALLAMAHNASFDPIAMRPRDHHYRFGLDNLASNLPQDRDGKHHLLASVHKGTVGGVQVGTLMTLYIEVELAGRDRNTGKNTCLIALDVEDRLARSFCSSIPADFEPVDTDNLPKWITDTWKKSGFEPMSWRCWNNAFEGGLALAKAHPDKKIEYCEGYTQVPWFDEPYHHAWICVDGEHIDITLNGEPIELWNGSWEDRDGELDQVFQIDIRDWVEEAESKPRAYEVLGCPTRHNPLLRGEAYFNDNLVCSGSLGLPFASTPQAERMVA